MSRAKADFVRMTREANRRRDAIIEARAHYRANGSENEKKAVALADLGFGVTDIVKKTNVLQTVARAMVLGVP